MVSIPYEAVQDGTLAGVEMKKGTSIVVHHYAIHHNTTQWKEPTVFQPERFNRQSSWSKTPTGEKIHPLAWNPFSTGPRNCLGQNLAMTEIKALAIFFILGLDYTIDEKYLLVDKRFSLGKLNELTGTITTK